MVYINIYNHPASQIEYKYAINKPNLYDLHPIHCCFSERAAVKGVRRLGPSGGVYRRRSRGRHLAAYGGRAASGGESDIAIDRRRLGRGPTADARPGATSGDRRRLRL
ncbi:hypothetical protein C2S51_001206 [Perilla frutescens var. frutescens]|nr:hypothetical protein C2S51_001206 [Perilla frutescens var. frutescens]